MMLVLGLAMGGCDGDDGPDAGTDSTPQDDGSTSSPDPSTSSASATMSAGTVSASASASTTATTDPATSSTTTTPDDTGSTTTPDDTSGTTECPVGTEDCPCDDGSCSDDLVCLNDACVVAGVCDRDPLEPNDDEGSATFLGEISDDDEDGSSVAGVLDGPGDVDWYRYTGDDDTFSSVDPTRFVEASAGVRMCKFAECANGLPNTEFPCPDETEEAMSPSGRPGCCAPLGAEISDANCNGVVEDNMDVYIRVDQAEAACVDYEVIFHF